MKKFLASEPVAVWTVLVGAILQLVIAAIHPSPDIEAPLRALALAVTGFIARSAVTPN